MKNILTTLLSVFLLSACNTIPYEAIVKTGVAGTQAVLTAQVQSQTASDQPTTPPPQFLFNTPSPSNTYSFTPSSTTPAIAPLATITPSAEITATPQIAGIGQKVLCGQTLQASVPRSPEFVKDMFEHHAKGTFLIVHFSIVNLGNQPVQIWEGDYAIQGVLNDNPVKAIIHRPATTYLYIKHGESLDQDQIQPSQYWQTILAFDVDLAGSQWVLVVKPGSVAGNPVCELRFNLSQ